MIVVKIQGGLGNQLFQYAFAKHVAEIRKDILKLDISSYRYNFNRNFVLDKFSIDCQRASMDDLMRFYPGRSRLRHIVDVLMEGTAPKLETVLGKKFRYKVPTTDEKLTISEHKVDVHNSSEYIYIDGYWQDPKLFDDISDQIRNEFTLSSRINRPVKYQSLHKEIDSKNSVSIHIRCGDYENNAFTRAKYGGICDASYYQKAQRTIEEKVENPWYFVFSDDIGWVKANRDLGNNVTYIENDRSSRDYLDLSLMSECKHNIIANSTFSWWGAWLNQHPEKIVVTPKKWTNDCIESKIIPREWVMS